MTIDLQKIRTALFDNRDKLRKEYCLPEEASMNPEQFADALVGALDQNAVLSPLDQEKSNGDVFKAAVWAIGSNSRNWLRFRENEQDLRKLLSNYDPEVSARMESPSLLRDLKERLPGQTSTADACAIMQWARLLIEVPNYYNFVCRLGRKFQRQASHAGNDLANGELLPCVAGYLGCPPESSRRRMEGWAEIPPDYHKTPGMGFVLASEFLRNLGWNGFKPDSHVCRLFDQWGVVNADVNARAKFLVSLIGRNTKALCDYVNYSLLGVAVSPCQEFSRVDNLVWLLGAYVEKKRKPTGRIYLT